MRLIVLLTLASFAVTACANKGLRQLQPTSKGPDEFLVAPVKPLEEPADYATLPPPTPGQGNLTDRSALNEGVVAFGGQPQSANAPVPASDGALVNHVRRNGVSAGIREVLAEEDAAFRKRKARFTQFRVVPVDRYNQAYRRQALDPQFENARWRRAGARTPSAPPPPRRRLQ
ncbi:DUF3035 domain-containing protein [Sulfitobacter aestuariivivens]|uniref:DUF3035 domain-containing protein n=1 Tax=Sulfitobacter aestuariivivens TaxID=2766981 RepID=A0A927D7R8_9RHOB|nr:DUF3035 domain-containing protein [Sulfitobacter aestuariivivens]MBD3664782.1 DUF3035 domain-containing protein [Sulfitobacter aestuariivivens]